jgi:hypothetical protein
MLSGYAYRGEGSGKPNKTGQRTKEATMVKLSFGACVLLSLLFVTSCGEPDLSSGGGADPDKAVEDFNSCINYRIEMNKFEPVATYRHFVTNICDFPVNFGFVFLFDIMAATINPGETVDLGNSVLLFDAPVAFAACKPPAIPRRNKKVEGLFCFAG